MVSYKQHLQQMSKLTTRVVQRGARYHRNVLFLYCYYSIVLLTGHLLLTMGCKVPSYHHSSPYPPRKRRVMPVMVSVLYARRMQ